MHYIQKPGTTKNVKFAILYLVQVFRIYSCVKFSKYVNKIKVKTLL